MTCVFFFLQKGVSHKNMACVFFCLERKWGSVAQIFRVERTKNFTVMSNHHFKNKNLTLKAKGLLSLMLSLKYQAEQNRKTAENEVQKLKKRIRLQSEKINEIKFFCGIGYIVALVLSACLIKMCFL